LPTDNSKWQSEIFPSLTESQRQRPMSTLSEAASQIGVRSGTLRTLLEAEGKISEQRRKGSPIRVQRQDITRLTEDYADSVSFADIPPILGVGRKIAMKLRDAALLPVWIPGGKNGPKHRYLFRRRDIEAWVNELIGDVPLHTEIPEDCLLLADAPNRKHIPIYDLVGAIRDRRVPVVAKLRELPKFGGAIVRAADVDAAVPLHIRQKMGTQRRGPRGSYRK
jgi:hypothetical protein